MIAFIDEIRTQYKRDTYFIKKLEQFFAAMDSQYESAANHYGFQCTGCEDNCCFTRFYHHTFVEFLYVLEGFETLAPEDKIEIKRRADEVCAQVTEADNRGVKARALCPLSQDSLCILYPYRPMICRLHGVPHELNTPGQGIKQYPGCDYFMNHHKHKDYFRFDRTPMYMELANIEREFRQKTSITDKVKLTVAEMISTYHF